MDPKRSSTANSAIKYTFLLVLWRCTSERIPCLASARSAERLSPDHGSFKVTSGPILVKNLFRAPTATEHLQTGQTWGHIFKHTQTSRNTLVRHATKRFRGCLCWLNTPKGDALDRPTWCECHQNKSISSLVLSQKYKVCLLLSDWFCRNFRSLLLLLSSSVQFIRNVLDVLYIPNASSNLVSLILWIFVQY